MRSVPLYHSTRFLNAFLPFHGLRFALTKSAEDGNEYAELLLRNAENQERAMITNTVASLLTNIGRIIEEDNMRSRRKISHTDRKLLRLIQRKKQELGIKSEGVDMHYDY